MPNALHDLRGQILRRPTESIGHFVTGDLKFAETKISQFYMALRVKNNVLRLEVSVDYTVSMEALERKNDLSCVKARSRLFELGLFAQVEEKFATIEKIDYEIQPLWRLESIVQLDDERMIDSLQDHSLHCTHLKLGVRKMF